MSFFVFDRMESTFPLNASITKAIVSQLVCLSNLENLNAVFINEGMSQAERLAKLNAIAISQMEILTQDHRIEALEAHSGELSPIE